MNNVYCGFNCAFHSVVEILKRGDSFDSVTKNKIKVIKVI